jgi:hypothetical protein
MAICQQYTMSNLRYRGPKTPIVDMGIWNEAIMDVAPKYSFKNKCGIRALNLRYPGVPVISYSSSTALAFI